MLDQPASGAATPPQQITRRVSGRLTHANTHSPNDNIIVGEGDCPCACVLLCAVRGVGGRGGCLSGFPPGSETNAVRQIRFPIGTENIHTAGHRIKKTLPKRSILL